VIEFALSRGGSARLVALEGELVTISSSNAAPPGTPLEASFEDATYRIKVRSCRRTDEDPERPFRIEGRFQNLSREARARLENGAKRV
jgi:hypothetical protein